MTAEQALQNLYTAARNLNASAEIHENLRKCYEILLQTITVKEAEGL